MVWKEPQCTRYVSASSRIRCQDHRTIALELRLLDRTRSVVHVGATHLGSLRQQTAFDASL